MKKYFLKIKIFVIILCVLQCTGCSSFSWRFIGKTIGDLGAPIDSVRNKITQPILEDTPLSVLWVGHATCLIQIHDKVFITDPLFTKTAGMLSKRIIEPGIDPSLLTKVDFVLISHLHFDHLSYGSLDMLPKNGTLIIPEGAMDYIPEFHFSDLIDLHPYESYEMDSVKITAVPARHFSGRYGYDALWMSGRAFTGYVIEYCGKTVYFAGDTRYDAEMFKEIGRKFSIDLAILPIAPIEPKEMMRRVHMDPAEAVRAFEDLHAREMIPMHYRTLNQGFDSTATYAQDILSKIISEKHVESRVHILSIGERKIFP